MSTIQPGDLVRYIGPSLLDPNHEAGPIGTVTRIEGDIAFVQIPDVIRMGRVICRERRVETCDLESVNP